MAPLQMTLSDLQGHFSGLKPFEISYFGKHSTH